MPFGGEGIQQEHWSHQNLEFAYAKLQEQPPKYGIEGDTGEKDGKYFAMGYELQKDDYDTFLEKITSLYEEVNTKLQNEFKEAA